MSTAYYYFAASLPLLKFDESPSITLPSFLEDCERLLLPADYQLIRAVLAGEAVRARCTGAVSAWIKFSEGLRNGQAEFRAEEFNKDPLDYVRGEKATDPDVVDALAEAAKAVNPLAGERALDRLRWQKLDEIGQGHYFDFDFIFIYAVRLMILTRYRTIASPRGAEIFEEYKSASFHHFEGAEIAHTT